MNENRISLFDKAFWPNYLIHMRPYLLFISGIAGLLGMSLYQNTISLQYFLFAFIPFFLAYGFGQALTDCFQVDTDAISSPYRPLSKGVITTKAVAAVSVTGLLSGSLLLIYLNSWNIALVMVSVLGLATYSYFKKHSWLWGPFYNSWVYAVLLIIGYISMAGKITDAPVLKLICAVAVSFFSYTHFVIIGYLKDISADRDTGYQTFPVVWGWDKTALMGDIYAVISLFFAFSFLSFNNKVSTVFFIAAVIFYAISQGYAHLVKNKTETNALIPTIMSVRALYAVQASLTLDMKPAWQLFVLLLYFLFELVLFFRPDRHQI